MSDKVKKKVSVKLNKTSDEDMVKKQSNKSDTLTEEDDVEGTLATKPSKNRQPKTPHQLKLSGSGPLPSMMSLGNLILTSTHKGFSTNTLSPVLYCESNSFNYVCKHCHSFSTYYIEEIVQHCRHCSSILVKHPNTTNELYCYECGLGAPNSLTLKRHIHIVHTGEKPYKCIYCTYASNVKCNVETHCNTWHSQKFSVEESDHNWSVDLNLISDPSSKCHVRPKLKKNPRRGKSKNTSMKGNKKTSRKGSKMSEHIKKSTTKHSSQSVKKRNSTLKSKRSSKVKNKITNTNTESKRSTRKDSKRSLKTVNIKSQNLGTQKIQQTGIEIISETETITHEALNPSIKTTLEISSNSLRTPTENSYKNDPKPKNASNNINKTRTKSMTDLINYRKSTLRSITPLSKVTFRKAYNIEVKV